MTSRRWKPYDVNEAVRILDEMPKLFEKPEAPQLQAKTLAELRRERQLIRNRTAQIWVEDGKLLIDGDGEAIEMLKKQLSEFKQRAFEEGRKHGAKMENFWFRFVLLPDLLPPGKLKTARQRAKARRQMSDIR